MPEVCKIVLLDDAPQSCRDKWPTVRIGWCPACLRALLVEQDAKLDELRKENASIRKHFRRPTHGPCCTCQACGQDYDTCRCDLDAVADELAKANAKAAELQAAIDRGGVKFAHQQCEIAELQAVVDKLPKYADTGGPIVPGVDEVWQVSGCFDSHCPWKSTIGDSWHLPGLKSYSTEAAALAAKEKA